MIKIYASDLDKLQTLLKLEREEDFNENLWRILSVKTTYVPEYMSSLDAILRALNSEFPDYIVEAMTNQPDMPKTFYIQTCHKVKWAQRINASGPSFAIAGCKLMLKMLEMRKNNELG
jgi:hypothetical protein